MLEDEQKLEELEAKVAALSSQVESLGLEKEIDPFFEDDVRRLIEDFREKEIAELEESDELDEPDESEESDDFISVQTTGGRTFKVHWISPESCDDMTKAKARAAFSAGAAERYGTSQQVNGGDVMILLCRQDAAAPVIDPESDDEGFNIDQTCHYIGMAVNTGVNPTSLEPPLPDTSEISYSSISSGVGNFEIFVWSSCECSEVTTTDENDNEITITGQLNIPYVSLGNTGTSIDLFTNPSDDSGVNLLTGVAQTGSDVQVSLYSFDSIATAAVNETVSGFKAKLEGFTATNQDFTGSKSNFETFETAQKLDKRTYSSRAALESVDKCGNLKAQISDAETLEIVTIPESEGDSEGSITILGADASSSGSASNDSFSTSTLANTDNSELSGNQESGTSVYLPLIADTEADKIQPVQTDTQNPYISNLSIEDITEEGGADVGTGTLPNKTFRITEQYFQRIYNSGLLTGVPTTAEGEGEDPQPVQGFHDLTISQIDRDSVQNLSGLSILENYEIIMEAEFPVIYEDDSMGEAQYHFYKQEKVRAGVEFETGLLKDSGTVTEDASRVHLGTIKVPQVEVKYSCHPTYGCIPDPLGSYDESTCGGDCESNYSEGGWVSGTGYGYHGVYEYIEEPGEFEYTPNPNLSDEENAEQRDAFEAIHQQEVDTFNENKHKYIQLQTQSFGLRYFELDTGGVDEYTIVGSGSDTAFTPPGYSQAITVEPSGPMLLGPGGTHVILEPLSDQNSSSVIYISPFGLPGWSKSGTYNLQTGEEIDVSSIISIN